MIPVVIYVMGVTGSGKSTIGEELSAATGFPFFDGDDFHSAFNKNKLKTGIPLKDEDRWDWLLAIHRQAKQEAQKKGAIFACSALKEKYRALLTEDIEVPVHFVFLKGDFDLIMGRIKARKGHFMPVDLLQSQFETLEIPRNAIVIDINNTPHDIIQQIIQQLNLDTQSSS